MNRLFISYRRQDAATAAGGLERELRHAFGDDCCFFDVDSVLPGAEFLRQISAALTKALAVLVVIGPGWLEAQQGGRRRLDDPADTLRQEVELALGLPLLVIPVLVEGAPLPARAALPESLWPLLARNALQLRNDRWHDDFRRLIEALEGQTALRRLPPASDRAAGQASAAAVKVGEDLQLSDAELGQVTGVRGGPASGPVEVLKGARLRKVRIGDITGVDLGPPPPGKS